MGKMCGAYKETKFVLQVKILHLDFKTIKATKDT